MKTVMILAHPDFENSIANKRVVEQLKKNRDQFEVRDLTALYPDFKMDVEAEQKALLEADTIVFQYPFYWYNMPGILKEWFDQVFTYGFAYGSTGDKLKGKNFLLSFTIGGPKDAYQTEGYNNFPIKEFTYPMIQTANLAQMNYIEPVYGHGLIYIPNVYNTQELVEERTDTMVNELNDRLDQLESEYKKKG